MDVRADPWSGVGRGKPRFYSSGPQGRRPWLVSWDEGLGGRLLRFPESQRPRLTTAHHQAAFTPEAHQPRVSCNTRVPSDEADKATPLPAPPQQADEKSVCENWSPYRIRARLQSFRQRPSLPSALSCCRPKNQGLKALDHKPLRSARLKACPDRKPAAFTHALKLRPLPER